MKTYLLTTLLAVFLFGCSDRPETAQETFKQYLRHVFLDQDEQAWALVLPEDREQLVTLKAKLEQAGSAHELDAHETLLVRAIINPYAIKSVTMLDPEQGMSEDDARLEYQLMDGRKGTALMRRVDGLWYVKMLPAS